MSWSLLLAVIGCVTSIMGMLAAALAVYVSLTVRTAVAEAKADWTRALGDALAVIRRDINGSYMRAAEVREIIERIETEIHALATRIATIEARK